MRILVTGAGGPAGTNLIALYPNIKDLVACDANPDVPKMLALVGKGDVRFYNVPRAESPGFIPEIRRIIENESPDMLIPTVDEELSVIAENRDSLGIKVLVSPKRTIDTCLDKALLYSHMSGEDFCPRFIVTSDRKGLEGLFGEESVFMKPRSGRGSRGVMLFDCVSDIPDDAISEKNVFCENLPGKEYTVDCLFDSEGRLLVAIPRIRLETMKGISIRGKTEKNSKIIKNVDRISKLLGFFGPVNMQFKLDTDGQPRLVEINPRLSGGLPLSVASGIDVPRLLPDIAKGKRINTNKLKWKETESFNDIVYRTRK
jgi:carbamoyl-phosphate synthase large subunit